MVREFILNLSHYTLQAIIALIGVLGAEMIATFAWPDYVFNPTYWFILAAIYILVRAVLYLIGTWRRA